MGEAFLVVEKEDFALREGEPFEAGEDALKLEQAEGLRGDAVGEVKVVGDLDFGTQTAALAFEGVQAGMASDAKDPGEDGHTGVEVGAAGVDAGAAILGEVFGVEIPGGVFPEIGEEDGEDLVKKASGGRGVAGEIGME